MRRNIRRWMVVFGILTSLLLHGTLCDEDLLGRERNKTARDVFAPRMDYDQWKPLGRGDPLKDDPTYDYVPPVLDRVHYWIDPASRKPDPPANDNRKTEILLLGVSSKKPSTGTSNSRKDMYDQFMKFVDGPKFNNYQRLSRPQFNSDYFPSYTNRNKFFERNAYSKGNDQRIPYTILVPPPLSINKPMTSQPLPLTTYSDIVFSSSAKPFEKTKIIATISTTDSPIVSGVPFSTPPDVTIQSSNLVYASSSLSSIGEWNKPSTEINGFKSTWKTTPATNLVLPNSNKINHNFKDIMMAQKPIPESYIQIDFSMPNMNYSHKPLLEAGTDHNINFIARPSFGSNLEIMHKGQVSDDNLDISNTYVKIGKTEAQVHASDDVSVPIITQSMNPIDMENMMVFSHIKHPSKVEINHYTHTIQDMQTMQPPPITISPIFTPTIPPLVITQAEKIEESNEILPTITTPLRATKLTTTMETTIDTTTEFPTTTSTALTTDPFFKHYKQPIEPMKGPLYLIIQGHSKVKTYGPSKSVHGIAIQETNEIQDEKDDNKGYEVDHLHYFSDQMDGDTKKYREGRSGKLQTLKHVVQTGLGAINSSEYKDEDEKKGDFQETEVRAGFEVLTGEVTSEKYHKGIVEAARKLKDFTEPKTV